MATLNDDSLELSLQQCISRLDDMDNKCIEMETVTQNLLKGLTDLDEDISLYQNSLDYTGRKKLQK